MYYSQNAYYSISLAGFSAIDGLINLIKDNYTNGKWPPRRHAFDDFVNVWDHLNNIDRKAGRCFTAVLTIGEFGGEEEAVTRLPQSDVTIAPT